MKYSKCIAFSTIALAVLTTTGCVKKSENKNQVAYDNSQAQGVYGNTTYEAASTQTASTYTPSSTYSADTTSSQSSTYTPNATYDTTSTTAYDTTSTTAYEPNSVIYDNTALTPSGSIYTGEATDTTQITTSDAYNQPVSSNNGAFNDPYAAADTNYPDPYASKTPSTNNYSYTPSTSSTSSTSSTRSTSHTTTTTNSHSSSGGIQLQIAALADYYAAKEFKNSLSLDPKYSAYVKKGFRTLVGRCLA